jgi:uncharacterized coiled-coil DUF342 family protein
MDENSTSYAERLQAFRKSDEERDLLVTEIIQKYDELKLKYDEKHDDWQNEQASRRLWQEKFRNSEQSLVASKQASASLSDSTVCEQTLTFHPQGLE